MTPEERADNLFKAFREDWMDLYDEDREKFVRKVASEICAAVEEATGLVCADCGHVTQDQFKQYAEQVKASAYEDAAKIAEKFERGVFWNSTDIAAAIRARAKEV